MTPIRLGIAGVGKIARDQHLPAIAANPDFELVAAASRHAGVEGVPSYADFGEMLETEPSIEAVALCVPPEPRRAMAELAIARGKHVLLEKPPGATLSEVEHLIDLAREAGVTLFATWHSRFAPAVETARDLLADANIEAVAVTWKEDVRRWHPGQDWIWEPGGFGVFDPGINALSIVTAILPRPLMLLSADLTFPRNRAQPIAASLTFRDTADVPVGMEFDWRQTGPQSWDVEVASDKGRLLISGGGARASLDGRSLVDETEAEYPGIYRHFADLVRAGRSDADLTPLRHVADAFMAGRRHETEAFHDGPAGA
ncbi:Gfo/Idh/MocA family oxidoreductase [Aurantimonas sp. Leaf443]|uniref:Gfo/Idh/MocA family protein n=1 Tax=Aurantimonas sp. Leaf443 TaxID=1736378 RepID=UPI0006FFC715|nr:Gfo/Idh/MocA family oxidoreductase [Aurantimonas sp. Leaf443]KQT88186.1 galactose 1-dehydrogenase [Aurantimonas sp. Leaf443]